MNLFKLLPVVLAFFISVCSYAQPGGSDTARGIKIFTKVQVEASFPGGDIAWRNFLIKNLNTDVPEKNDAPAGHFTVIAKFIVSKEGEITNITAETNVGYGMEEEVKRVIKKSGKWTPAQQNNQMVNAYRRQPVTFAVLSDAFTLTSASDYVFYTNTENELTVEVPKLKPENIDVTISKGSIKQIAEGKYIVKVDKPGRVIIEVLNTKKNKSLGTASFEVKAKK